MKRKSQLMEISFFCGIFMVIAIISYLLSKDIFLLFNFSYIGLSIGVGIGIYRMAPKNKKWIGRMFAQFCVGMYMVLVIGLLFKENIQIEGFIVNLLLLISGDFAAFLSAGILHYFIAKTIGVAAIGRSWCGWACWYPALFNLLPYKKSKGRVKRLEGIPVVVLGISVIGSIYLWNNTEWFRENQLICLAASLVIYYLAGLILVFLLKDNRALCKYFCPVPLIQKRFTRFSILHMEMDPEKCNGCGVCERNCPMNIELLKFNKDKTPVLSGDCILCRSCADGCPRDAVSLKFSPGRGKQKNYVKYHEVKE